MDVSLLIINLLRWGHFVNLDTGRTLSKLFIIDNNDNVNRREKKDKKSGVKLLEGI